MNIQHLRYFVTIAHYENISKASQELLVSQPALSSVLQQLESELETQLFERQGKKLKLTRVGYRFLQTAEAVIGILDRSIKHVKDANWIDGSLRVCLNAGCDLVFDCITAFTTEYPNVQFSLQSRKSDLTMPVVSSCDLVVATDYEARDFAQSVRIAKRKQLYVVLPENHPLSGRSSIQLKELEDEFFLFGVPNGGRLVHAHQRCIDSGFIPKIRYMTESFGDALNLLRKGNCITLTYNTMEEFFQVDGLKLIPCEDPVIGRTDIYLCLVQEKPSAIAEEFFRFVCERTAIDNL